ncbi:MAG: glucose-6-phosphate isomerase, partial [Clostridia bacterium]|nr:glucose-6-phosphate isomerase [Clostridia bacterium]
IMFETVLDVQNSGNALEVTFDEANIDGLNFLAGKTFDEVNRTAMLATVLAHTDGGVPNLVIEAKDRSAATLGQLIYFFELANKKYGDKAKERIFATTDKAKGTLKSFADKEGWETFVVPDDVGGRFSVLTAVGLLPIAVAGIDIDELMTGAADARAEYLLKDGMNDCLKYAGYRNALLRSGKSVEILASYEPSVALFAEWWKQLYGESEGKDGKGIYPSSVIFSTDLHSLGQYIQEGQRIMFETVLDVQNSGNALEVTFDEANIDGLNFLAGKTFDEVNRTAMLATVLAHTDGGVPNLVIEAKDRSAATLGQLIYFFELACAVSGYVLDVNPFDQPGVEAYKKNMFALLGKPGYEAMRAELLARMN